MAAKIPDEKRQKIRELAKKKASNEEGKRLDWDYDLGWAEEETK